MTDELTDDLFPIAVIFHDLTDYPDKYVVWLQWPGPGGAVDHDPLPLAVTKSLGAARAAVPARCDTRIGRYPEDDPAIVEVWL